MIHNILRKVFFLPTLSLTVLLTGCDFYTGFPQMSGSIEESVKKKVFIREFIVPKNPYKINDTILIDIKEAWVENHWKYNKSGKIIFYPGYQLIIICNPKDIKQYSYSWTIGTVDGPNFRSCAKDCIMADFKELLKNKEAWVVQEGRLANNTKPKIIGKFELIKK